MGKYYVYILLSAADNFLYIGQTNNLKERVNKHNSGKLKSTKSKIPYRLVYFEDFSTRSEAMGREWEFKKKWNKQRKLKLIEGFDQSKIIELMGP